MDLLRTRIPEFRRAESLGYPLPGMLSLIVMAMATGVRQAPDDLETIADSLSHGQLRALNFRRDVRTRKYRRPKRTTFRRVLEAVDPSALEAVLLQGQEQLLRPTQDPLAVVDGNGRFLGGVLTPDKTNEIPVVRKLLRGMDRHGKIVLADALHTCEETARAIHFEKGGHYLLTVKGNQPALQETLKKLFEKQPFSRPAHGQEPGVDPGAQLRAV